MKNTKLILASAAIALMVAMAGCSKKDDSGNSASAPEPEGTVTANISASTAIGVDGGSIGWTPPGNFYICGDYFNNGSYGAPNYGGYDVAICDMGKMNGLGNITNIPQTGYNDNGSDINNSAPCEVGHGYVVKFVHFGSFYSPDTYTRLYVVESIVSGGVIGAKVKYQYPFEPESSGN